MESKAEALQWLAAEAVPRGTLQKLSRYVALLEEENQRQNLIARSTLKDIWHRHILDSAQLWQAAPPVEGSWLDIGSGAGLPGVVLALLRPLPITLSEPRALRVRFLERVRETLGLTNVAIAPVRVERLSPPEPFAVITARAVAPIATLFAAAHHLAASSTIWLLPKGRSVAEELAVARQSWQGDFRLQPSITDPAAAIVIARNVRPRNRR